jgi:ParB family chromosome partitioning protein
MTSSHRPALGRGLSALIPRTGSGAGIETVDIDLIVPNPHQPRLRFDAAALSELAESIREHGVLQPIVVTQSSSDLGPMTYQLIAGERRLQAARMAGLERMPVVVREAAGKEMLEIALVENLQRQDLNPLEEAQAFRGLNEDFGMTQEQIAARVGRSRTAVANTLRLLSLENDIRASLASGQISEGHARALLGIEDSGTRLDTWRRIVSDTMTVRETEDIATALRSINKPKSAKPGRRAIKRVDPHLSALEDELRQALGMPVAIKNRRTGGSIVIRFHSEDELLGIITRIAR